MRGSGLIAFCVCLAGLAGCIGAADTPQATAVDVLSSAPPLVTIAHVDTGINPYHVIWRTDEPFALDHPSSYIPGYPADAKPLDLTFDAGTWEEAVVADEAIWSSTEEDVLYYVPGTRIVGMINLGSELIIDDHGHGTMTASRSAGPDGLAPNARFVSAQGLGADRVKWIADQGWIDVQTNSWGSLVPLPSVPAFSSTPDRIQAAATQMPVIFASGNGNGFNGVGPNPTWMSQTAPPGALQVGGHDNGRVTLWHGVPDHVVADYFGGPHASRDSYEGYTTDGIACCTSAAAPYAAGGMAAIVLDAREILADTTPGITTGANGERILASTDDSGLWPETGPLEDGVLTLDEAVRLFLTTAQTPVREGPHDGVRHWGTQGTAPEPTNPSGNPYCQLCWGTPIAWEDLPQDAAYLNVGYGSIDPWSSDLAREVLEGQEPMPERPDEDAFFAAEGTVRAAIYG